MANHEYNTDIKSNKKNNSKLEDSANIPEPIKRIVRQNDGFGCCVCGKPIIQYHHIIPRSEDLKDIMLLCPEHHDEVTDGAMQLKEQLYYKNNPYNIINGNVIGKLKINQEHPVITLGRVEFVGRCEVVVDNETILYVGLDNSASFDKSYRLSISLKLYNQNDELLINIRNNEWISGDHILWDIQADHQYLILRRKLGDIAIEINAKKYPVFLRADLWRKKQHILLHNDIQFVSGVIHNSNISELCIVSMKINVDIKSQLCTLSPLPEVGLTILVSEPNRKKRIRKGLKEWEKIKSKLNL